MCLIEYRLKAKLHAFSLLLFDVSQGMGERVGKSEKEEQKTTLSECTFSYILEELCARWTAGVHFHPVEINHTGVFRSASIPISNTTKCSRCKQLVIITI